MTRIVVWALGGLLMVWISRMLRRRRTQRRPAPPTLRSTTPGSGDVFAAAQVLFLAEKPDVLAGLLDSLPGRIGIRCFSTEWRGFGTVVPQLGVATRPVGLTVQVDSDPDYVPAERDELAEQAKSALTPDALSRLKSANSRLGIMSASPDEAIITDDTIEVHARTDLDPLAPDVDRVLRELIALTNGVGVDCVNGKDTRRGERRVGRTRDFRLAMRTENFEERRTP